MNYLESVAYIESLAPTLLDPDLARFASFMRQNGNLQDKFHSIHVAGTNGKGSTVAIVESVLRSSGLRTGRYTGPHLLRWNERFQVDGRPVSDEVFAQLCTELRELSQQFGQEHPQFGSLTWFEFLTAIAFFWFAREGVDVGVIEVGLGGRWDATTVLTKPMVTAITTIDYDHMHILGSTLTLIAAEKAGIIKHGVPLVTAASGEALVPILERAKQFGASPYVVASSTEDKDSLSRRAVRDTGLYVVEPQDESAPLDFANFENGVAEFARWANYQELNALVSYLVLALAQEHLHCNLTANFFAGLKNVYWPGRFQFIPERQLLMDGAHNAGGSLALRTALDRIFPQQRRLFVLSFFENKDVSKALRALLRPGDVVFAAEAQTHRAVCKASNIVSMSIETGAIQALEANSIEHAFRMAEDQKQADDLIIATGSFATVKETMIAMGWKCVEDGIKHTALAR